MILLIYGLFYYPRASVNVDFYKYDFVIEWQFPIKAQFQKFRVLQNIY